MTDDDRSAAGYRLGIDIGGTFSDAVVLHEDQGEVWSAKALTTSDPADGALDAIDMALAKAGIGLAQVKSVVHATTLVPNTIIQRRGATVGFVTNAGFEDIVHIAREVRYDTLQLDAPLVEPLVLRRHCRGVAGRILADGTEYQPFDAEGMKRILEEWRDAGAVSAIAICLLHSYRNPAHEDAALSIARAVLGEDFPVALSSRVAPEIREFERASTTIVNAYVQPVVSGYLHRFEATLRDRGYAGRLFVMLSEGGVTISEIASQFPARMLESGPAGGVLAAAYFAKRRSMPSLVAFDVGGTTAKACLVRDGKPSRTASLEVARTTRFAKGSGITVQLPSVDLIEIGAGGGSIAHADFLGLLKVGPQSAEARPGPACFGRGGDKPTVTDANVVLGYLNPDDFAGGTMTLDVGRARDALAALAEKLDAPLEAAALAIIETVSGSMADAMRVHLAEQGQDPRSVAVLASGGGGPLHAALVARKLGIGTVVVPARAGVLSAIGLLATPAAIDLVRSHIVRFDANADRAALEEVLASLEQEAETMLAQAGADTSTVKLERWADLRWVGQTHSVTTPVSGSATRPGFVEHVIERFDAECARIYGSPLEHTTLEALTWRVRAKGPEPAVSIRAETPGGDRTPHGERQMWFHPSGAAKARIYQRHLLRPGFEAVGPAAIEDRESTALVGPGDRFQVDAEGNLVIRIGAGVEELAA
jgi:5-oxoprolinase (ATP-hydrolysing)/N-methylhydantoinase A